MLINRLETHDRFEHFSSQSFDLNECCKDLIEQKPFGDHPFYIFCHPRTDDDGLRQRYIWQPRITKPRAQTNSMLVKAYPGKDTLKVIWTIPPREMWDQYSKGKLCENKHIFDSVFAFINNREALEAPDVDDPNAKESQRILFEYQPQLFRRETLPDDMKSVWDIKMKMRDNEKRRREEDRSNSTNGR